MSRSVRRRTFEILEVASTGDLPSRIFDTFIMTLILLNVLAVILETVESLLLKYRAFFTLFEVFSVAVFTIEYLLRLWSCSTDKRFGDPFIGRIRFALTPFALVDLMAFLPFYLPMILPLDLRFIRILRLFRFFRVFKIARYSESLRTVGNVVKAKKEELIIVFSVMLILLILASSLMYFSEHNAQPKAFPNIPAAMWWGVATLTTVGYGDVCPISPLGKSIGAIIAVLGIGMFALPAGILASGFAEEIQKSRGNPRVCPHCGKEID